MGGMSERERESGVPLLLLSADIFTNMREGAGGGREGRGVSMGGG